MTSTTSSAAASAPAELLPGRDFVRARVLVLTGTIATFAAARAYAPYVHDGPVLCVLRGLTGLPCPGCGLTRAFCALSHGDVGAALGWNALSLPLAVFMLAASLVASIELARGARGPFRFYRRWLYSWRFAEIGAIAIAGYHIARCIYWAATGQLFQ